MKTADCRYYARSNRQQSLALLVFSVFVLLTGSRHAQSSGDPPREHANGQLTRVEANNIVTTVIIDKKRYAVDPAVLVVNAAGRPTTLDKITLPADITFQYSYTSASDTMPPYTTGPKILPNSWSRVIVYLEEGAKNHNNGKRR